LAVDASKETKDPMQKTLWKLGLGAFVLVAARGVAYADD
jgi:hypothetical protein